MNERIVDLEIRFAYLERHLTELDAVVRDLAGEIRRLHAEVEMLRDGSPNESPSGLEGERPPHYDSVRFK